MPIAPAFITLCEPMWWCIFFSVRSEEGIWWCHGRVDPRDVSGQVRRYIPYCITLCTCHRLAPGVDPRADQGDCKMYGAKLTISPRDGVNFLRQSPPVKFFSAKNPRHIPLIHRTCKQQFCAEDDFGEVSLCPRSWQTGQFSWKQQQFNIRSCLSAHLLVGEW